MKLTIGVCCLDYVMTPHYTSMLSLAFSARFYDPKLRKALSSINLLVQQGNIIPDSRRSLAEKAIEMGSTHLWFIDSDVVVSPEVLNRLIGHHKDFVCATYRSRYNEHLLLGNRKTNGAGSGQLVQMATVPLGCALIKLSIFERLPRPWFNYLLGPEPGKVKDISEDAWFCKQCAQADIPLWMDPGITLGHVGIETF